MPRSLCSQYVLPKKKKKIIKTVRISDIIVNSPAALFDEQDIEDSDYLSAMINADLPPIKINSDYELVDGHHRLSIAKYNKQKTIECQIVDNNYINTD